MPRWPNTTIVYPARPTSAQANTLVAHGWLTFTRPSSQALNWGLPRGDGLDCRPLHTYPDEVYSRDRSRTHHQRQCPVCGLWALWIPKMSKEQA